VLETCPAAPSCVRRDRGAPDDHGATLSAVAHPGDPGRGASSQFRTAVEVGSRSSIADAPAPAGGRPGRTGPVRRPCALASGP
jgi:hypothetical protein